MPEHKKVKDSHTVPDDHHGKPKPHAKPDPKAHGKKHHPRGKGVDLVGSPEKLLKQVFSHPAELEWAEDQIKSEGPDHKQVHSALLLQTMFRLLQKVEHQTGIRFKLQPGEKLHSDKSEHDQMMSVCIPSISLRDTKKEEVLETLAGAPEHELIVFSTLLQSMEWAIDALSRTNSVNN